MCRDGRGIPGSFRNNAGWEEAYSTSMQVLRIVGRGPRPLNCRLITVGTVSVLDPRHLGSSRP